MRHIEFNPERKINLVALTCIIFFTVCGGAFGIESLIGKLGAGWAIALIIVTPLLWSLPISLMVSELASAMPEEGGYYIWVKRALGDFWGFQEGWWTCLYTSVDMAIYPVLFVNYLAFFVPYLRPDDAGQLSWESFFARWTISVTMIFLALALNWRGARAVGINSTLNLFVIVVPFGLLTYFGLASENGGLQRSIDAVVNGFGGEISLGLIAVGLATVMWNYSGYDNVSTYAAEVNNATRNYPRALFAAVALSLAMYFLPVFALIGVTTEAAVWNEAAGFPALAEPLGGPFLGTLLGVAALVSAWSLFNSQILYASRLPFAMANDGWFPEFFARTNKTTGIPTNALVVCCVISALFTALPFGKLVVIDILFYSAELLLEFVALLVLRVREPDLPRPFRIRGGWPVLILITIAPMGFAATVIWATLTDPESDPRHLLIVGGGLLLGVVLYFLRRKRIEVKDG
jgi:amino acid transporter